jgi:hypothetical protein
MAVRAWGSGAVLQAGAALVLASAADRKRLGGSTFKDMNFGLVVSMVRPIFPSPAEPGESGKRE